MADSDGYTHKRGIVYKNQYHIIWCPKYRRKILVGDIEKRLGEVLREVAADKNITIKSMEIMPDHVHMFIDLDPRESLHTAIQSFKGRSSRVLRAEFPQLKKRLPCLWTRSYYCCTVGHISEKTIENYIQSQKRSQNG